MFQIHRLFFGAGTRIRSTSLKCSIMEQEYPLNCGSVLGSALYDNGISRESAWAGDGTGLDTCSSGGEGTWRKCSVADKSTSRIRYLLSRDISDAVK